MKLELKRVDPVRAANIGAVVYGLLATIFALIFSPFFLLGLLLSPSSEAGFAGPFVGFFFLILYPVMGVVMGWLTALLTCAIYNFVIRWTGGLVMDFDGGASAGGDSTAGIVGGTI